MKLYEIDQAIEDVIEKGFVVNEETGEVIFDESNLEELRNAFADKLEACGIYAKETEAMAAAIKAEEQALAKRRKALESKAASLKTYMLRYMTYHGETSIETARVKITTRRTSRVIVSDADALPDDLVAVVTERKPDKRKIKAALQSGEVPGAQLVTDRTLKVG